MERVKHLFNGCFDPHDFDCFVSIFSGTQGENGDEAWGHVSYKGEFPRKLHWQIGSQREASSWFYSSRDLYVNSVGNTIASGCFYRTWGLQNFSDAWLAGDSPANRKGVCMNGGTILASLTWNGAENWADVAWIRSGSNCCQQNLCKRHAASFYAYIFLTYITKYLMSITTWSPTPDTILSQFHPPTILTTCLPKIHLTN
jgi:hypothetical protein